MMCPFNRCMIRCFPLLAVALAAPIAPGNEPGVVAIPKSARAEHVRENHEAGLLMLDDQDLGELDNAFPAPNSAQPLQML